MKKVVEKYRERIISFVESQRKNYFLKHQSGEYAALLLMLPLIIVFFLAMLVALILF